MCVVKCHRNRKPRSAMTLDALSPSATPACAAQTIFNLTPPNTLLTRQQAAKALTDCGLPTSPKTLATKATRGGGPPFRIFGKSAVYLWADVVAWVLGTMGEPACTTSEHRARQGTPAPRLPSPEKLAAMVDGSRRYNAARVAARSARRSTPGEPAPESPEAA
jgi:hypothetical protein